MKTALRYGRGIGLLLSLLALPVSAATNIIDILVIYTQGTADAYGGDPSTRINQLLQVSNQIYADSGVNAELRLAGTQKVNYTDDNDLQTALNDITYASNTAFAGVASLRTQLKADLVLLYRPYKSIQGGCGMAWINGIGTNGIFNSANVKPYMYANVAINTCGDYVTVHELGHNMGLRHSRKQDSTGGTFPFALGYGVDGQFVTIMAYQSSFNVDYWAGKVYKFSSPSLLCKNLPCGVDRNDPVNGADAQYTLNITTPQIANLLGAASSSSAASTSTATSSAAASVKRKGASGKDEYEAALKAYQTHRDTLRILTTEIQSARDGLRKEASRLQETRTTYHLELKNMVQAMQQLEQQKNGLTVAKQKLDPTNAAAMRELENLISYFSNEQTRIHQRYIALSQTQALFANMTNQTKTSSDNLANLHNQLEMEREQSAALLARVQQTLALYQVSLRDD